MLSHSRREFLQTASASLAAALIPQATTAQERSQLLDSSPAQLKAPQLPHEQMSETEIIQTYALKLPDTPWRQAWNQAYEKDGTALESGGDRIVDGRVLYIYPHTLSLWDCQTYCFEILRRGGDLTEQSSRVSPVHQEEEPQGHSSILKMLLSMGFYPVREPKDFDVVMYFNILARGGDLSLDWGHWGLYKDGKVISKDLLSRHVYKHLVEESAANCSHVMYFRHKTHPDPRDYPLPANIGPVYFIDVDGIAMPAINPSLYWKIGAYTVVYMTACYLAMSKGMQLIEKLFSKKSRPTTPDSENE
jgi:hypothetical protein